MRLVIDEAKCLQHKLTLEEALLSLVAKKDINIPEMLKNLCNRGIISNNQGIYSLSEDWNKEIQLAIKESGGVCDFQKFMPLAKKMRECFPEGIHPVGHSHYKTSTVEVAKLLVTFFNTFGSYSEEEIIDATKRYIASFNGNYQMCLILRNFIFLTKDVPGQKKCTIESSKLADFLENKEDSSQLTADDWTINMRV